MSLDKAVYSRIKDATKAGSRVYPHYLPQGAALPALSYFAVSDVPDHCLEGSAATSRASYQISAWARGNLSTSVIETMLEELRQLWEGYRGTVEGVTILSSWVDGDSFDDSEWSNDGNDDATIQGIFELGILYVVPVRD